MPCSNSGPACTIRASRSWSAARRGINSWPESSERRVRAVVEPVSLPWLGAHVLYFEEFLHDDPDNLRRQLLVKLEPAELPGARLCAPICTRS